MNKEKFLGFSFLEIALVLIWSPLITWFNANITPGEPLGLFFWIVLGVTFLYFMSQILVALFE